MTNKEAMNLISRNKSVFQYDTEMTKALDLAIKTLESRQQGEWIKYKKPDKDGAYLCISGIGNMACFRRILYFTHDLYQIDRYAFHKYRYKKKTERSGWYTLDSEMGYFEVDVHAWCELPEMPEEFRR